MNLAKHLARVLIASIFALMTCSAHATYHHLVQEFFVPLPEDQVQKALSTITSGVGAQMNTVISIVVTADNTYIHYDHWEDGYEVDLENPTQSSTEILGPYSKGTVITFRNAVDLPRDPSVRKYDGRDRIGASIAVVATRAEWATTPGTVLAGAAEMLSLRDYGTDYKMPVGQNEAAIDNAMFKYVGMLMVASQDNTSCTYTDIASVVTYLPTQNRGSNYQMNGGVKAGDHLVCDKPVQVHLITGDVGAKYESRWFLLYPSARWSSDYYTPVGTSANGDIGYVFVYNPAAGAITVNYETLTGTGSFSVAANSVSRFQMPVSSGGHFYSTTGSAFYAVGTFGATPASDNVHDWGTLLVPKAALTTEIIAGWAPGNSNIPPTDDGNPLWVTVERDTTVYVDYHGDGGPLTAANGQKYDVAVPVKRLQSVIVAAPNHDNTGTRLFTTDGTLLTGAWGQNSAVAGPGAPYLDMGTSVLPFPVPSIQKSAALMTSDCTGGANDTNGIAAIGECLRYTLTINNAGLTVLDAAAVVDSLGTGAAGGLSYMVNTTKVNGALIADGPGGLFPLAPPGYLIQDIPPGASTTITYDAKITAAGALTNSVYLNNRNISASNTFIVPPATPAICTLSFTGTLGGSAVTTYSVGNTIYVTLSNADLKGTGTQAVLVKNPANGSKDTETVTLTETGVNTGIFTGSLPSSGSAGQTSNDGTFFMQLGDSIQVSSTYPTCAAASASVPVPTKTKTLYLSDDGTSGDLTGSMSRTVPVSGTAKSTAILGGGSQATIAVAATTGGSSGTSATSLTFSHTPGSGSNRLLLVAVATGSPTNANGAVQGTVSGVTFNGVAMTLVGSKNAGSGTNTDSYIFMMKDASISTSGAANVVVTATSSTIVASATTFTGVDQTTPLGTYSSNSGTTGSLALASAYVSATGELLYSVGSIEQGSTNRAITTPAGQTELWNVSNHAYVDAATSTKPGAASVSPTYGNADNRTWTLGAVSIKPATTVGNTTATFTQTPTLASELTIPAGATIAASAYYTVSTGGMVANPSITATLKYGATTIATSSGASASSGLLTFTFPAQAGALTIPAGQAITLDIVTAQSGVTFTIDYDGSAKVSKIDLPTTTVITVDSLGIYDAAYPGGSAITSANNGQTLYARATVSDPFGAYDITSLNLNIDGPGTACDLSQALGAGNVVSTTTTSKIYEYPWATGSCQGGYTVTGTALEGTEGTVTATGAAQLNLTALDLGTPGIVQFLDNTGADKTSYTTSQQVCLKVTDLDQAGRPESIVVYVSGGSGGTVSLTLTETPASSGIFKGCFGSAGSSSPFSDGNVLSATYTDPTDATDVATDTAVVTNGAVPSLLLSKVRVSPASGITVVGGSVQYDITATNTGGSSLATVALTDTYSSSCYSYQSASIAPSSNSAGSLVWTNVGPIAAGGTVRISVTLVAAAACNSTAALNSVSASASGGVTAGPATATVTINDPRVTVTKTRTSALTAGMGDTVTFDVVVNNSGNTNIATLPVSDSYSSCLRFVSSTPAATSSGGGVALWSDLGALATGASSTIHTSFQVVGTCSPAQNTAEVNFATDVNGFTAVPGSASATVNTTAASISGQVVNDNGAGSGGVAFDGVKNGTEPGIANVTVKLYRDPNGDGNLSDATLVAVQTTDSSGNYTFLNLEPNTGAERYVAVQTEPPQYRVTSPVSNKIIVNVTAVQDYPGNNFLDAYAADVIVQKNGPAVASTSGALTYTVHVYNAGPGNANGTLLTDNVPSGVTNMTWTCGAAVGGAACPASSGSGAISQTIASLPAGGRLTYTVSATAPASGSFTNTVTATVPSAIFDPDTSNKSSSVTTGIGTALTSADLSVGKYGPASVSASGAVSYVIVVSNAGPGAANNAVFADDAVTAGLTGVAWTCGNAIGGALCPHASGSGAISETIATFPAGSSLSYSVSGTAPGSGTVTNTATVSAPAGVTDPDTNNNTSAVSTLVTSTAWSADLAIAKTGSTAVAASSAMTYKLVVSNAGPDAVTAARVIDAVPSVLTGVTWTCGTGTGGGACNTASGSGNGIDTTVDLPAGASVTITVSSTSPAFATSFINTARVIPPSGTGDPTPGNNISGPVITTVNPAPAATDDSGTTPVSTALNSSSTGAGQSVNNASILANDSGVGITLTSVTGTGSACSSFPCTISTSHGSVVVQSSGTYVYTPTTDYSGSDSFTYVITDNASQTATATVNLTVVSADMLISLAGLPATATQGVAYSGSFTCSNAGTAAASGATTCTITSGLPAGVSVGNCTISPANSAWVAGNAVAAGQTVSCTVSGIPTSSGSTTVYGSTGASNDSNAANNTASLAMLTNTPPAPVLTIAKTHSGNFTQGQSGAAYSIVVSNNGTAATSTATLTVTDTLPAGLSFVSGTGSGWSCSAVGQSVTCTSTTPIAVSGSSTITLTVNVAANAGTPLTNSVSVTGGGFAGPTTASDPTTIAVGAPKLGLSKNNGAGTITEGSPATYILSVSNSGNIASSGTITMVDVLPTGMSISAGAVTPGGANGANWSCSAAGQNITCTSSTAIAAAGSSVFSLTVNIGAGASGLLTNRAQVGGGGDPTNPSAPSPTTAGACSGTNAPTAGCAVHADTVTLIVSPAAANDSATTALNTPVKIIAHANDSAGSGATIDLTSIDLDPATPGRQTSITVAGEGTFDASANDGTVTFTPVTGFTGVVTVPYTIKDSLGHTSNNANITVTVLDTAASSGPVANNDSATTTLNTWVTIDVTANDAPGTGHTLTVSSVDLDPGTPGQQTSITTAQGSWTVNGSGLVTYTPASGFTGTATLAYTVQDSASGTSNQATITVVVSGATLPLAQNDSASTTPGIPVTLSVLNNDSPGSGQTLTPTSIDLDPSTPGQQTSVTVAEGTWTANADGTVTFTPVAGFSGTATRNYTVQDSGSGTSNVATITVVVNPATAPTAVNDSASTPFNTPVDLHPASNDSAAAGAVLDDSTVDLDPLTAGIQRGPVTVPGQGSWQVTDNIGNVRFTPVSGFVGTTDPFSYAISDSLGHTATATMTVTVVSSDMLISLAGLPATATQGVAYSGSFTCSNAGTAAASGATTCTITSGLPAGVSVGSCTISPANSAWVAGNAVAVGQTVSCTVSGIPTSSGSTTVYGSTGASNDSNAANNTASLAMFINTPPAPALTIAKTHSGNFTQGQSGAAYSIVVSNNGTAATSTATLTVTDTLPAGLSFVSGTGSGWSCSAVGQSVTCTSTTPIAVSGSSTITLTVNVAANAGTPLTNSVSVTGGGFGGPATASDPTTIASGQSSVTIFKTVYQGRNSGSACPGVSELVIVDAAHAAKDITWCFAVTNTGNTYLTNPLFNDPGLGISAGANQALVKLRSGVLPLAPGASATWYVEESRTTSLLNTVTVAMTPSDSGGVALLGQPAVSATSAGKTTFAYVFDPPFGIKTGQVNGVNVIRWTMVWINDNLVTAQGVIVTDPPPTGMTYAGNIVCTPQGSTVVNSCGFEAPSSLYPRGRVMVVADMGPDLGATNQSNANNALQIAFDATIDNPAVQQSFQNQGTASWTPPGGPTMTGTTSAPGTSGDPTTVPFVPAATPAIPTLSEWGMILLSGFVGIFAMFRLRRQRARFGS